MSILAIDAGTSSIKAAVVEAGGTLDTVARRPAPRDEGAGVDPDRYWATVAAAIRDVAEASRSVEGVTVTGQGDGLWTLDERGDAAGPAFGWNTAYAAEVVRSWEEDGTIASHFAASGTVLWPGTSAALWRWLEQTDPEHVEATRWAVCAKDWINQRLCGAIFTDVTDGTIPFLDIGQGVFSETILTNLGCGGLIGRLPELAPVGTEIGRVSHEASQVTGIAAGTPVLMGCIDVAAVMFGSGLTEPGQSLAVLGTTAVALAITDRLDPSEEGVGATLRLQTPERYLRVLGANSGTSTLDWYLDVVLGGREEADLDRFWVDVATGDPGVVMLPYLSGERAPFLAPDATGTFLGLTPSSTRADISRSVAVGITFSLRHCLEYAGRDPAATLVLSGGGASSAAWCQLVADVMGTTVAVDERPHVACIGAAGLATEDPSIAKPDLARYEPRKAYDAEFDEFVTVGRSVRPLWSTMRRR